MMNCENCGHALAGGAIVCRECKHNNALRRIGGTRAQRKTTETFEAPARRVASFAAPTRTQGRTPPAKVQPIRPLKQGAPALAAKEEMELRQAPPWRAQLKEQVRQARERRQPDEPENISIRKEPQLDSNPLVESALNRLQRSNHTAAAQPVPRIVRRGALAAAPANEDKLEVSPAPEPKPAPKLELQTAARQSAPLNSSLPRRSETFNHQPPAPPAAERAPIKRAEDKATKALPQRSPTPFIRPVTARAETKAPPQAETTRSVTEAPPQAETRHVEKPALDAARLAPLTAGKRPSGALPDPPAPSADIANPTTDVDATSATPPPRHVSTPAMGLTPATQVAPKLQRPPSVLSPARNVQLPTLWVRTLAGACDFEVVGASSLPLFAFYATLNTSLGSGSLAIMVVLLAAITFCYQMLALTIAGRTFGMALLKLRLFNRDAETRPPTRRQYFNRALGATVAFLCPPLNLLVMRLNHERRSLPDLCSQTTIIES